MLIIKVHAKSGDLGQGIITFASDQDAIGDRAIRAFMAVFGYSFSGRLQYKPCEDAYPETGDLDQDLVGHIRDSGEFPIHSDVFIQKTEDTAEDLIISGHFLSVWTSQDLKDQRPHTVLIINKTTPERREITFPNLSTADLFCEEYDANMASLLEDLFIEDENGVTIYKY